MVDEGFYKFTPKTGQQEEYTLAPITFDAMYQQKQEQNGHLAKLYFYYKLEDLLFTDYVPSTTVYGRFIETQKQYIFGLGMA